MTEYLILLSAIALGLLGLAMGGTFVALAFLTFLSLSVPNYRLIAETLAVGVYAAACVVTAVALLNQPTPFWLGLGAALGAVVVVLIILRKTGRRLTL